ncbi:WG repeat-containing protein [Larkinella bovis]|uniref:WG repeat-containing protein n=1 Tax=Larkinella bovis TaxID=683041 RepID=A0ABW0IJ92_9BACT
MIDTIRQQIQEVFGHHERYVSADVINDLFVAIPSDETVLTQEIMGYLLEHNYEALTPPRGQSLRERLISTDWRQKENKKWVSEPEFLMAPALPNAIARPVPTSFAQSNRVLVALVILIVSILLWFWNGKLSAIGTSTNAERADQEPSLETPSVAPKETTSPSMGVLPPKKNVVLTASAKNKTPILSTVDRPEKPADLAAASPQESVKPYDMADTQVGDFGLRAARKGNKWGYIDQKDQWHIEPMYDDVTPFNNGKATVVLDGQQITIDRDGVRIREEN